MGYLFGQIWIWIVVSFVLGLAIGFLVAWLARGTSARASQQQYAGAPVAGDRHFDHGQGALPPDQQQAGWTPVEQTGGDAPQPTRPVQPLPEARPQQAGAGAGDEPPLFAAGSSRIPDFDIDSYRMPQFDAPTSSAPAANAERGAETVRHKAPQQDKPRSLFEPHPREEAGGERPETAASTRNDEAPTGPIPTVHDDSAPPHQGKDHGTG